MLYKKRNLFHVSSKEKRELLFSYVELNDAGLVNKHIVNIFKKKYPIFANAEDPEYMLELMFKKYWFIKYRKKYEEMLENEKIKIARIYFTGIKTNKNLDEILDCLQKETLYFSLSSNPEVKLKQYTLTKKWFQDFIEKFEAEYKKIEIVKRYIELDSKTKMKTEIAKTMAKEFEEFNNVKDSADKLYKMKKTKWFNNLYNELTKNYEVKETFEDSNNEDESKENNLNRMSDQDKKTFKTLYTELKNNNISTQDIAKELCNVIPAFKLSNNPTQKVYDCLKTKWFKSL